jgi:hypothetical protein
MLTSSFRCLSTCRGLPCIDNLKESIEGHLDE